MRPHLAQRAYTSFHASRRTSTVRLRAGRTPAADRRGIPGVARIVSKPAALSTVDIAEVSGASEVTREYKPLRPCPSPLAAARRSCTALHRTAKYILPHTRPNPAAHKAPTTAASPAAKRPGGSRGVRSSSEGLGEYPPRFLPGEEGTGVTVPLGRGTSSGGRVSGGRVLRVHARAEGAGVDPLGRVTSSGALPVPVHIDALVLGNGTSSAYTPIREPAVTERSDALALGSPPVPPDKSDVLSLGSGTSSAYSPAPRDPAVVDLNDARALGSPPVPDRSDVLSLGGGTSSAYTSAMLPPPPSFHPPKKYRNC
eukprot:Hpha_TRINITY_DN26502_c0_g1::TRINITY_DN26502_c0_g1_i1::g.113039::m.113039